MKRIKLFVKNNYIIIIPFFTTLFLYLLNAIINKIYPFGNETFIYSDMSEQYSIYFSYIKDIIFSGNSLFSSFSFSLGQNFYGIFTYFCASPLNIIFLFSTRETIPIFVLILVLLKLSLASMNMAILLRTKLKNNISIFMFSILYGLMSYNLVYSTNIMWLDPMYLLPLIILGFEKMLAGKPKLYLITLTLAMCSNYYIAFSVCIFLIIYFIYYSLLNKISLKKGIYIFIKYSIIATLLSAVILLPTIFNMLDGKFETTDADFSFKLLYNPLYLFYRFLAGDVKIVMSDLPFITSSLIVLIGTITYLFNKNVTIKDKIYTFLTIALLLGITLFACTDTIMHCFRLPNQFSYRYAFIISFFLILISSKNFDNFDCNNKNIFMYLLMALLIFSYLKLYIGFKTIISSILVLIYFLNLIIVRNKKILIISLVPFLICEIFINISESFNEFSRVAYEEYSNTYKYMNEINALKPNQNEFYRITGLSRATLNDALSYGYYGVTSFSPTMSVNANRLLKDYFGEPLNPSYAVDYVSRTDFTDSFLNVKYIYKYDEKFEVYENKYTFPLMFKMSQNDRFKESKVIIENQNNLYKYLANTDDNLFVKTDNYRVEDCNLKDNYLTNDTIGYCTFYPTKNDSKMYLEIDSESFEIVPLYEKVKTTENYGYHMIFDLNKKSRIYINDVNVKLEHIASYEMDENKLSELSKELNNNKVNITSHNQNKITGNIINDLDNQIIFTSIPYDFGWHVEINGEEVETFKNLDSLLAFKLPKGESNIKMYFIPKGYIFGLTISLLTFDILVAIYIRKNKKN